MTATSFSRGTVMTLSCHAHCCAFSIIAMFAVMQGGRAQAQQLIANGTNEIASGNYDTTASGSAGYALWALNGGTIVSSGVVTATTSGNGAYGAYADQNGSITITSPGSSISTTGTSAFGVYAWGADARITLEHSTITTQGNSSYGLYALDGGSITAGTTTITTMDDYEVGAYARGTGSIITLLNGVAISTQGQQSAGLEASGGGVTADGITISTMGEFSFGAVTQSSDSFITLQGVAISTEGKNGHGLASYNGGTITAVGGTITTKGEAAYGASGSALGIGSNIELTGVIINTQGQQSHGLNAQLGDTITSDGGTISTEGDEAHGAWALDGLITLSNGVAITTEGSDAYGLNATSGGIIEMTGGTVITTGDGAVGAGAVSPGALITLIDTEISTEGDNAHGLYVDTIGRITLNTGAVVTSGSNAVTAMLANGSSMDLNSVTLTSHGPASDNFRSISGANSITLYNSSTSAADGIGINVTGGSLDATIGNSTLNADRLLNVDAGATLTFEAANSTLFGAATTAAGGNSDVNLFQSTWHIPDNSSLTSLSNGADSLVQFTPPASAAGPFKTLTVNTYSGAGGALGINTHLGTDGSPSDRLVIDNGVGIGTSSLRVNNVGGGGDLTTLDGILVVDAINGSTTVPGLFTLAAPVVAGPYEYSLYRGGENGANPDNWYLRSDLDCALDPSAAICGGGGDDIPDWRQETSLYAAVPAMTLL
ncbi:pertactin-like passenger domain-containing protein [Hyphomicrobium sp. D-2]|uniref:pertactin-like passenger domain-containing protein n=1 Tax=Hyphomicrobium sp. D-2 TaxID=3041621 RepID=UPI0024550BE7|nr:pertactin-like passenger domain-containing protein [Hyphomicrobium sp. D-2]MDH4982780.1 pertactin-like passenger domain-containing protein [Hyphomicrobium sp. D-2]